MRYSRDHIKSVLSDAMQWVEAFLPESLEDREANYWREHSAERAAKYADEIIAAFTTEGQALCLHCGFKGEVKPFEEAAKEVLEHGETCEKHPMRVIEAENRRLHRRVFSLEEQLAAKEQSS